MTDRHAPRGSRGTQRGRGLPPCCAEIDEPPCPQHEQAAKVIPHQGPRNRHAGGRSFVGESGKAKPARSGDQP